MIDGLKLTLTGEELRARLQERVEDHQRRVEWYRHEKTREPDPNDEYDFCLPEHQCEYGEELHDWRARALAYIAEHIEGGEVYRLSDADLAFGEILPEKPGSVRQSDFERDERIGSSLERIAKEIGRSGFGAGAIAEALMESRQTGARPQRRRAAKKTARAGR
jgi:hypothetical protein